MPKISKDAAKAIALESFRKGYAEGFEDMKLVLIDALMIINSSEPGARLTILETIDSIKKIQAPQ